MEYYSAIKRNTSESVLMGWMNLEHIIHSEVIQKVVESDLILFIRSSFPLLTSFFPSLSPVRGRNHIPQGADVKVEDTIS